METEKIVKLDEIASVDPTESGSDPAVEEYGRCRLYNGHTLVTCSEKSSETACMSWARDHNGVDGYSWAPGWSC